MSGIGRSAQIRALLDQWFPAVILVLVLLAAIGGWWTYGVHAQGETETELVTVEEWTETTSYEHSSLIVNDSLVFTEGERVTNRPVYYVSLSDELDVTYEYEHTAETGSVNVSTDMQLVFRGVEGDETLWEYTEPMAENEDRDVTADDSHTVNGTIEIESVFETVETVEEQLGEAGTIEIRSVSTSRVEGTLGGEAVSETYESTMPITVNPQTFRVEEVETVEESGSVTDTVEQPVEPGTFESVGSVSLLLVSLAGLAGSLVAKRRGYLTLSADERELMEIHQQEEEFSEWITKGTFPSERDYEATIIVDDLEGLVDVAIDTNKRVIKDEQLGVSTVLDGEYIYVYVRPDSPASDWLVNYADTTMDEFEEFDF